MFQLSDLLLGFVWQLLFLQGFSLDVGLMELVVSFVKSMKGYTSQLKGKSMTHSCSLRGTDNVLLDLGFDDAIELTAKAVLAMRLKRLIADRALNQDDVSAISGMTQIELSQVSRCKLQSVSLERLIQALVAIERL